MCWAIEHHVAWPHGHAIDMEKYSNYVKKYSSTSIEYVRGYTLSHGQKYSFLLMKSYLTFILIVHTSHSPVLEITSFV
jgi:hypothetical protein